MRLGKLDVEVIGRGFARLEADTPEYVLDASQYVSTLEKKQGLKIACIEEIPYRMVHIDAKILNDSLTHFYRQNTGNIL